MAQTSPFLIKIVFGGVSEGDRRPTSASEVHPRLSGALQAGGDGGSATGGRRVEMNISWWVAWMTPLWFNIPGLEVP